MSDEASAKVKACPICGKPRALEYAPFCSRRCADIDLGRWLKGSYVIPGPARDETGEDEEGAPPAGPVDPKR